MLRRKNLTKDEIENIKEDYNSGLPLKDFKEKYNLNHVETIYYHVNEKYKNYKDIYELKKYCNYYGVNFVFQPSLVRGLSYYNKNVFEIRTEQLKETICGGGSYIFNGIQSTGISFGVDRLSSLAKIDLHFRHQFGGAFFL